MKYAKSLGNAVSLINSGITLVQAKQDFNDGKKIVASARLCVLYVSVLTDFIPVVGPVLSVGIGLTDAVYGDDFYNYLNEKYYK